MPSLVTSPTRLVPPSRASALLPLIYPTCFCAPGFSACLVGRWCVSCSCNVGASLSYVVMCHSTEQGCTACTPACHVINFAHVCICVCMYQPPECSASRVGTPWHTVASWVLQEEERKVLRFCCLHRVSVQECRHTACQCSFARAQACWCRLLAGLVKHLALIAFQDGSCISCLAFVNCHLL